MYRESEQNINNLVYNKVLYPGFHNHSMRFQIYDAVKMS